MSDYRVVEENLRCAMRFFGEATGSGKVRTLDRTIAMYSGLDYGVFNIALLTGRATPENGGLEAALMEAGGYFKERSARWSFWLCEDLVDAPVRKRARQTFQEFGLRAISHPPGMFASALSPPLRALPAIECVPVSDPSTRRTFAELTSISFEIPMTFANAVYTPDCAWNGDYHGFVGMVQGRPVAIAAIVAAAGAVGIYSVGTLPAFRRRGYGEALLRAAVAQSSPGSRPLVLQSTEAGYALYQRMGFRDVTKFTVYLTK
jgi:GNAT superfamily N-acetyltransferase